MSSEWIGLLSALLVALVSGGATVIVHRLSRKDTKEDRQDEIVERLDKLDHKIDVLSTRVDETAVVQARVRILRFADELSHRQHHSKEHFMQIMEDINIYNHYVDAPEHKDFKNEMTVASVELIRSTYASRLEKNDFD